MNKSLSLPEDVSLACYLASTVKKIFYSFLMQLMNKYFDIPSTTGVDLLHRNI